MSKHLIRLIEMQQGECLFQFFAESSSFLFSFFLVPLINIKPMPLLDCSDKLNGFDVGSLSVKFPTWRNIQGHLTTIFLIVVLNDTGYVGKIWHPRILSSKKACWKKTGKCYHLRFLNLKKKNKTKQKNRRWFEQPELLELFKIDG